MKKTLALLTLSLLMIASLIIGVNATIQETDIGVYIRFDSQKTVEENAYGNSLVDVSFDAEKGALRATTLNPFGGGCDNNLHITFNGISLDDYPYMRVTYWRPKTLRDGTSVIDTTASGCIFMNGVDKTYWNGIIFSQTDTWARKVLCWTKYNVKNYTAGTKVNSARFDIPNDITYIEDENKVKIGGRVIEFYIYDVGFFKTAEAAYAYNPIQDYYLIDFTKDTTDMWASFAAGLTMKYDAENKETTFTQPMASESHDGRASSKGFSTIDNFSSHTYKYIAAKFKTNTTGYGAWFLNQAAGTTTAGDVGLTTAAYAYGAKGATTIASKYGDGETWTVGYVNTNDNLASDYKIMRSIIWDPINTTDKTTMTEDLWRTFKYVAFYATEDEAKLEPQSAPDGITVTAPTAKDGKGIISGVTTAMEYRTSVKDAYTAIETTDGTMAADAGTTYYIRYAAKEGYNPGYVTTVIVPIYWDLDITALKFSDGEIAVASDKIVKNDKCNWTVTVPTGIDITKLVPVYTLTTGVSDKYTYAGAQKTRGINLYVNGNSAHSRKAVSGGFGDNFNEDNEVIVKLLAEQALEEYITIKFVSEGEYNESEVMNTVANAVLDKFRTVDGETVKLTNYAHNQFLGKTETEIKSAIQEFAIKIASRYTGDITATVTVSEFDEPTKGTLDKKEGKDGLFKVSIALTSPTSSKTEIATLPVPAAHYRIILNFGSPILESHIAYLGTPESTTYLTGEMVEDSTSLLGRNLKLVKHTTNAKDGEFNITFYPGDGVIPEIKQLADYPVVVYRHKDSRENGHYQIFYYTDGYSGEHAYQDKTYNAYNKMTTNIYEVPFEGQYTGTDKTGKDTRWANKLTSIRFDFMRQKLQDGDTNVIWSEIDYIGLFATKADAESFVAEAALDYADETQASIDAKYKTKVDALKAIDEEKGKTINVSCDEFDLTDYGTFKTSIKKYVNDYVKNTYFADDNDTVYYVAISDVVRPVSGTEENPLGTNGGCTFRIYFADSATNGYAASTGYDIKVNVLAKDALSVTMLGAQIRADKTGEVSLRFGAQVDKGGIITAVEKDKNLYANLGLETVEGVSDLKFGMLIIPEFALSDNLTFAKLEEKTIEEKTTYWLGDTEVANVQCVVIYDSKDTDFTYTAVVTEIGDEALELVARPYAKYTVDGVEKVVYFDQITRSYNSVKAAFEANSELGWDK